MNQKEINNLKTRIQSLESEIADIKDTIRKWDTSPETQASPSSNQGESGFQIGGIKIPGLSKKSPLGEKLPTPPSQPKKEKPPSRTWEEWEFLLGGNWMAKIGVVAILLATGWFLDYAFTNDWVTDSGKIYIGLVFGLGFAGASNVFAKKGFKILTPAILGSGFSILYLSIFSAYRFYNYFSIQEAFVYLTIISLATVVLSKISKSEIVYFFGYFGTLLSPVLLSTGENSYRFLFSYLLVSLVLFGWASRGLGWKWAPMLVFFSNWLVFDVWAISEISHSSYTIPAIFILLLTSFFLYRELFLEREVNISSKSFIPYIAIVGSLVLGSSNLAYITYEHYPSLHSFAYIVMAVLSIGFAYYLPQENYKTAQVPLLFYIGIGLLLIGISVQATGSTLSFSLLAFAFAYTLTTLKSINRKDSINHSLVVGYGLWLLVFFRLIAYEAEFNFADDFFINSRFGLFFLTSLGLFSLYYYLRKKGEESIHAKTYGIGSIVILILGFLYDVKFGITDPNLRNQGYSIVLGSFAGIFLFFGFRNSISFLRKTGIALLGIVILKFALYDMWNLSLVVKIFAGFIMGVILLILGLFYEKLKTKIFGDNS